MFRMLANTTLLKEYSAVFLITNHEKEKIKAHRKNCSEVILKYSVKDTLEFSRSF